MTGTVEYSAGAAKGRDRMPSGHRQRLMRTLDAIAAGETPANADVKPLQGRPGRLRLRIGDWRAVYRIEGSILFVTAVTTRGDAYK